MKFLLPVFFIHRFDLQLALIFIHRLDDSLFVFGQDASSLCSSRDWIVQLVIFIHGFQIFLHAGFALSISQTKIPQVYFILLSLYLRKAYRHYISASRDFTCLRPLAFLWINFNENFNNIKIENSHNFIYIGNPNCVYIAKTLSTSMAQAQKLMPLGN